MRALFTFFIFLNLALVSFFSYAADSVSISLTQSPIYENKGTVEYLIKVTNISGIKLKGISVTNPIMSIETEDSNGGLQPAFTVTNITARHSFLSNAGTFNNSGDLNASDVVIRKGGYVEYKIVATVSETAIGDIVNDSAKVSTGVFNSVIAPAVTTIPVPYLYQLTTKVDASQYTINQKLIYTVTVKNSGSYAIYNLAINDAFADITAESIDGTKQNTFSAISISGKANGDKSSIGTFLPTGNLNVEQASISKGGEVVYKIETTVSDGLVGDIVNQAHSHTKEGDEASNELITPPVKPIISLSNVNNRSKSYRVGEKYSYTITVKNSGGGIAYNYVVSQKVSELKSKLANDLTTNYDSSDITDVPFKSWAITVSDIDSKSVSALNEAGVPVINSDLNDVISIYPGEQIEYTVEVTLSDVAIDTVPELEANVEDNRGTQRTQNFAEPLPTERVILTTDSEISRTKTTKATQYIPGEEVSYEITVENNSAAFFANNIQVIDDLSCVQTEQVDGSVGSAFSQWKLEVISEKGLGSDAGAYAYGKWGTTPVTVIQDLSPNGQVKYLLTVKVNDRAVGTIVDGGSCGVDNVGEDGSGIEMPDDNLTVKKEVNSHYYSPGDHLIYTIEVENKGDGYAANVHVLDELSKITTTSVLSGNPVSAFSSWTITAIAVKSDGSTSTNSDTGLTGPITNPVDLDVYAIIEPHSKLIYTIDAAVYGESDSEIRNTVNVNDGVFADTGSIPYEYDVTVDKRVNGVNKVSYSKGDDQFTYEVTISNAKGNGFAKDIKVSDKISDITANLLHPQNTQIPVFTDWTISAEIEVTESSVDPTLKAFAKTGEFVDNQDLRIGYDGNDAAQLPPGIKITYTIIANVDRSDSSKIIYGKFTNEATVSGDKFGSHTDSANIVPKEPDIFIAKTVDQDMFETGQKVTFNIFVVNKGAGYADNALVKDDIKAMGFFDNWTIVAETDSTGGTRSGDYSDNSNIDTTVDLAPRFNGVDGFITYHITGIVKSDYAKNEASNTVELVDPITDRDSSASAEIGKGLGAEALNVSIVKASNMARYIPGGDLIYTIYLQNSSNEKISNLTLVDPINDIKVLLANAKNTTYNDVLEGNPFTSWSVNTDGSGYGADTNNNLIYRLDLAPNETREFKIKAHVKDTVISKISNDAYVFKDYGEVTEQSHIAHHENNRAGSGGRSIHSVNRVFYSPGDKLVYTLNVSSDIGYYNNVHVNELINSISVELLDGSKGNPFYDAKSGENKFTVVVEKSDSNSGGTIDGSADGTGSFDDNENVVTIIDVGPTDKVRYTFMGNIRPDAIGEINYKGTTVSPYQYSIKSDKQTDELNYEPGKKLHYKLIIENQGKGNANDISVEDHISKVMVITTDGTEQPAFSRWKITSEASGTYPDHVDAGIPSARLDTTDLSVLADIPMGTTLTYTVEAVVNSKAAGNIINVLTVDGNSVSVESNPNTERFSYSKKILNYYDTDGSTVLFGGYTPNGYVEYEILINNINDVHLNDIKIEDDIAGITTDYYDGTKGPAFSQWLITTTTDNSGISNAGTVANNTSINTTFDLAASEMATGGTFVRYVIKAKVSEKAVGSFKNRLRIDNGKYIASTNTSTMLPSDVVFNYKVYTDSSHSKVRSTYTQSSKGSVVSYYLTLNNKGKGTEYNRQLDNVFSSIKTKLAENGSNGSDPKGTPFVSNWTVTVESSGDTVTNSIDKLVGGNDVDFVNRRVDIAAGSFINITIDATIDEYALGVIQSKAIYSGNSKKPKIGPVPQEVDIDKYIVSLAGSPYSKGMSYIPGDEVVYEITVKNPTDGWLDNNTIIETISDVEVEVLGGGDHSALENTTITHLISNGLDGDPDTYIPTYDAHGDLSVESDIGPKEIITFTVTGTIIKSAVGTIDANKAEVTGESNSADPIPAKPVELEFNKTLVESSAKGSSSCSLPTPSETGSGCEYAPLGSVTYQIMVKNVGEGTANDIKIIDELTKIKTSDGVKAFSSATVEVVETPSHDYDLAGQYSGNNLNANLDLMAGDRIVFEITGRVDGAATGEIDNTASVNGDASNRIQLSPGPITITAIKKTDTPEYTPGGEVHYSIIIANRSDANAEMKVIDTIDSFTVLTADGTEQTALKSWTISTEVLTDSDPAYTDISAIPTSGNINSVIRLGARNDAIPDSDVAITIVQITITGQVRDDAVGKFTNTANVNDANVRLEGGFIRPKPGNVEIVKETTVTPAVYHPGQAISFDITITNTGEGYAQQVNLAEPLDSLVSELANGAVGRVFGVWNAPVYDASLLNPDHTTIIAGSELNDATGYFADYNIHPGDSVKLRLTGVVKEEVLGDITNTATVSDSSGSLSATATYYPEKSVISLIKTVDKTEYQASDLLTYTLSVKNENDTWANDVLVVDELSKVMAEVAGGNTERAYKNIEISALSVSGESAVPSTLVGPDINLLIDIAPHDTVTFTIKAQLRDNVVGDIINKATADSVDNSVSDEAISTPLIADIILKKTSLEPHYTNSGLVTYDITVENKSNSFANDIHLQDKISEIEVESNTGVMEKAYTSWSTTYSANDPRTIVTNLVREINKDIDVNIDLAPNDTITFTVLGTVNQNAVGDIENIAMAEYQSKIFDDSVIVTPTDSSFTAVKTALQTEYQPERELEFVLFIENSSDNYINDMLISDDMAAITVKLIDGSVGPAFEAGTTEIKVIDSTTGTIINKVDDRSASIDIPSRGKVTFSIKGMVSDKAIGDIQNIATVDGKEIESPKVPSAEAIIIAELTSENTFYIPGSDVIYHLKVKNVGKGTAANVFVETGITRSVGEYIDHSTGEVFDSWTIDAHTVGADTQAGTFTNNKNLSTFSDINAGGYIDYTITARVNKDLITKIDLEGHFLDITLGATRTLNRSSWGNAGTVGVYQLPPPPTNLVVTKTADKLFYDNNDTTVTYSLSVENIGAGNAPNVTMVDKISELTASNGNKVFTSWTVTGVETDDSGALLDSSVVNLTDHDLNITKDLKSNGRNKFEFEIIGVINKGLDDDITNTFITTDNTGNQNDASATVHIKKIPDNSGELLIIKKSMKDKAQVGDVVEYEITLENNTESDFKQVIIEDRFPAGFQYVEYSTEIVHSGSDGQLNTGDDLLSTTEPSISHQLSFHAVDLLPTEKVRIRYLLRVSIGSTFGKYVNTAYATVSQNVVSNMSSATVEVSPDKVFDTATIIGKVFEDLNGDGYQADATANNIKVSANIDSAQYVANSTTLQVGNEEVTLEEETKEIKIDYPESGIGPKFKYIEHAIAPITNTITIDLLMGLSNNRTLHDSNRAIIQFKTVTATPFSFEVTTTSGSDILFGESGEITSKHHGDKQSELSAEKLNITRRLFKDDGQYLWEIEIENVGIYEDGIPGARLITVEGFVIETDEFGRYHIPDQWVTDKKGKQFLVKLESDSLPTGMKVISENPKVKRITPNALAKFNFSVQVDDEE
ncbi:MAG: DUF11 domain-containing protein [Aliivibrio sp.]|uniref:hypothetical protein n=1 Tax=Aliivibrio sp. TaxID=1872443 RepID=UPI001A51A99C|nr:DUF11 domain-containing protein [Aliivibrio sp.]